MIKNKIILTAIAGMVYITMTSYHGGAAAEGNLNRTGADGSIAGCAGAGCHTGISPAATAAIYIDSAGGVPVTKYTPGTTYNIRIVGKHTANNEFGFQFAIVSGTGSAQVQAGVFGTPLPTTVSKVTLSGIDLLEHSNHIEAISPADSFVKSVTWTAPASDVGNVTLYLAVNAINGDHLATSADYSVNISKTLQPYVTTGIGSHDLTEHIRIYPNPTNEIINIQTQNIWGRYTIEITDITGRQIMKDEINAGLISETTIVSTTGWKAGTYNVILRNDAAQWVKQIVKK